MITLDAAVALAIRSPEVMDGLGEALRSDLVLADPYKRRIVEFADEFLIQRRQLPGNGDWTVWLEGLTAGAIRDGTREILGRLFAVDISGFNPQFFAEQALEHLRMAAANTARARINEMQSGINPDAILQIAQKLDAIRAGGLRGLARLKDVETWAVPVREEEYLPTGYP